MIGQRRIRARVALLATLAVALLVALASPMAAAAFAPLSSFGTGGSGPGQMDQATGVAVDAAGRVYVGDSHSGSRIVVFNADGSAAGTIGGGAGAAGAGDTPDPRSLTLGPDGNLYVGDLAANRVDVFTTSGTFLRAFGRAVVFGDQSAAGSDVCTTATGCQAGTAGSGPGQLNAPLGVAVDASGDVFVTDEDRRVNVFTEQGSFKLAFGADVGGAGVNTCTTSCQAGTLTAAESGFNDPEGVTTSDGSVLVTDNAYNRVSVFSFAGSPQLVFGPDVGGPGVNTCTSSCQAGTSGGAAGQMMGPLGAAVGPDGNVYVVDHGNLRVDVFSTAGAFLRAFGQAVVSGDQSDGPFDICTAGTGCQQGAASANLGSLVNPNSAAFDCLGDIYVAQVGAGLSSPTTEVQRLGDNPASPPCSSRTLSVSLAGGGSGSVTGSGIACPATCAHSYPSGTDVTLMAEPAAGSTFAGWSGACSGTGSCSATMSADRAVTATFTTAPPGGGGGSGGGGGGSGAGAPPTASLAQLPAGDGNLVVTAVGSATPGGRVSSYAFQLGGDGATNVTCPGQDPVVRALVASSVDTVARVTVNTTTGATATTTAPITVRGPSHLAQLPRLGHAFTRSTRAGGARLGEVQAVALQCTPAGGNPPQPRRSASVHSVVAGDTGPTTANAGSGGCVGPVSVGIVQAAGCFTQVSASNPLPAREAQLLCAYQRACPLIGSAANPPLFFDAHGGGAATAAQSGAGQLGVDAVYYSTQPVRVDGVEIDPVNGGAIVLARAGLVQSSFWARDSAYLISSDAVVKVAGLPVSLHVPDYSGVYNQAQGAADCAQKVSSGDTGCLTSVTTPSLPNLNNLAPTVDGPINLAVSPEHLGVELGEFTVPRNVLPIPIVPDLPLTGTLKVKLAGLDSAQVSVHVELPGVLSDVNGHGLTGDTALTIDNQHGLELDFLHVSVPDLAQLGLARLKHLDFTYSRPTSLFDGKATLDLSDAIQGVINAELVFEHGDFQRAHVDYTANQGAGYPLLGPTFLTFLGADVSLKPTTIAGATNISVGPAATSDGCGLFGAHGTAKLVFDDPITLDLQGSTQILCADFGYSQRFHADSNGNVGYGVGVDYPIPDFGSVSGQLYGQAYADLKHNVFHFQIDGKADASFHVQECAKFVGCVGGKFDAAATATFSDIGAGACARIGIDFPDPVGSQGFDVGAGIDNLKQIVAQSIASGGTLTEAALLANFHILTSNCNVSHWRTLPPPAGVARAAQASPFTFDVARGTGTAAIGVRGTGGAPQVALTGPNGAQLTTAGAPDGLSVDGDALVVRQSSSAETLVEIPKAAPGRWTLARASGSAPIAQVETAHLLPAPTIRARVSGRHARRVLHYRLTPQSGLTVSFFEGVDGGARMIGTAHRAKGAIAFAPGLGSTRARTIIARLVRNGVPAGSVVVAHFKPPRVRPGRPSHIRVKRTRAGWRISFAPGSNTTEHLITIHFADGEQILLAAVGRQHSITVARSVDATSPTAVQVVGLRGTTRGPARIVTARRRRRR